MASRIQSLPARPPVVERIGQRPPSPLGRVEHRLCLGYVPRCVVRPHGEPVYLDEAPLPDLARGLPRPGGRDRQRRRARRRGVALRAGRGVHTEHLHDLPAALDRVGLHPVRARRPLHVGGGVRVYRRPRRGAVGCVPR